MNDKFGKFEWNCWKDEKPDVDKYVYIYDSAPGYKDDPIEIYKPDDVAWEDCYYWCYVFIPDAPVIEKKEESLEDRLSGLEKIIILMNNRLNAIESSLLKNR